MLVTVLFVKWFHYYYLFFIFLFFLFLNNMYSLTLNTTKFLYIKWTATGLLQEFCTDKNGTHTRNKQTSRTDKQQQQQQQQCSKQIGKRMKEKIKSYEVQWLVSSTCTCNSTPAPNRETFKWREIFDILLSLKSGSFWPFSTKWVKFLLFSFNWLHWSQDQNGTDPCKGISMIEWMNESLFP